MLHLQDAQVHLVVKPCCTVSKTAEPWNTSLCCHTDSNFKCKISPFIIWTWITCFPCAHHQSFFSSLSKLSILYFTCQMAVFLFTSILIGSLTSEHSCLCIAPRNRFTLYNLLKKKKTGGTNKTNHGSESAIIQMQQLMSLVSPVFDKSKVLLWKRFKSTLVSVLISPPERARPHSLGTKCQNKQTKKKPHHQIFAGWKVQGPIGKTKC